MSARLYLDNAHTARVHIEVFDPATGRYAPKAGLGLTVYLAPAPDSLLALDASLQAVMVEGPTGTYTHTFVAALFRPALEALVNQTIYEVVTDGANLRTFEDLLVLDARQSG